MGSFQVQMPDGTTRQVQGTTLAAAINNAGAGASAPNSGGSVSVQSAPQQQQAAPAAAGGGGAVYNTINGPRTVSQMEAELRAAGWQGSIAGTAGAGSVANAYAQTAGGSVTPAQGAAAVPGVVPQQPAVASQLGDIANRMLAALASGNKAAFDEEVRQYNLTHGLEVQKYQAQVDQYNKTFGLTEAGLTGTYNGSPTLAAQRQQADIAAQTAGLTGTYNGAPTLAAQQQQQTAANQYLQLISSLRGPNDPIQYLRTLQGTPQGLKDVVNAAAGRYSLGGVASGEQAAPATLGGQLANMNNAGAIAQANPLDPLARALPAANQIDNRVYNQQMLPSQKAALWSIYEYGGPSGAMRPEDAQAMFAQSLPRYAGPATGGINLKV